MKKSLTIVASAAALVALAAVAALFLLAAGESVSDPETARCNAAPVDFGATRLGADRREVAVRFTCAGAVIAGTLTLPAGPGRHPAVVWVHGNGEQVRLEYRDAPLVRELVRSGVAVLSYDKRGVGESEGVCCPGDDDHFNLLAADVDGAVSALRSRADVDPTRIGVIGASQAGWIVPLAVARSGHRVAFTALADGPAVTTGEEHRYSELAHEGESAPLSPHEKAEIAASLANAGPSGFDPAPYIEQMTVPGLWLLGGQDRSIPAERSAAILRRLNGTKGKAFTVVVFPRAGHGLLDVPPTDPRALPALVKWIGTQVRA